MTRFYPTATLRHLALRKRLRAASSLLHVEELCGFLQKLSVAKNGLPTEGIPSDWSDLMEGYGLAVRSSCCQPRPGLPFAFVRAINFELTYGCNLSCSHCLQGGLRQPGVFKWLDVKAAKLAIRDAALLGFTQDAINLTGGEIFMPGSPVIELLEEAVVWV